MSQLERCRHADRYKAVFPPRCGKGTPCKVCAAKWEKANMGDR